MSGPLRARLCAALLARWSENAPDWVRRAELQILTELTARAFGVTAPAVWRSRAPAALAQYAAFTVRCMAEFERGADGAPDREALQQRMYALSFRLGRRVRRLTGVEGEAAARLLFWLYQGIGIRMEGRCPGEIKVTECYFSRLYSPARCALISAMDAGIAAGLCGGGRFGFTRRITEGAPCCMARLEPEGDHRSG